MKYVLLSNKSVESGKYMTGDDETYPTMLDLLQHNDPMYSKSGRHTQGGDLYYIGIVEDTIKPGDKIPRIIRLSEDEDNTYVFPSLAGCNPASFYTLLSESGNLYDDCGFRPFLNGWDVMENILKLIVYNGKPEPEFVPRQQSETSVWSLFSRSTSSDSIDRNLIYELKDSIKISERRNKDGSLSVHIFFPGQKKSISSDLLKAKIAKHFNCKASDASHPSNKRLGHAIALNIGLDEFVKRLRSKIPAEQRVEKQKEYGLLTVAEFAPQHYQKFSSPKPETKTKPAASAVSTVRSDAKAKPVATKDRTPKTLGMATPSTVNAAKPPVKVASKIQYCLLEDGSPSKKYPRLFSTPADVLQASYDWSALHPSLQIGVVDTTQGQISGMIGIDQTAFPGSDCNPANFYRAIAKSGNLYDSRKLRPFLGNTAKIAEILAMLDGERPRRTAFFTGLHPRAGAESPLLPASKRSLFDPQVSRIVFDLASTSSNPKKALSQEEQIDAAVRSRYCSDRDPDAALKNSLLIKEHNGGKGKAVKIFMPEGVMLDYFKAKVERFLGITTEIDRGWPKSNPAISIFMSLDEFIQKIRSHIPQEQWAHNGLLTVQETVPPAIYAHFNPDSSCTSSRASSPAYGRFLPPPAAVALARSDTQAAAPSTDIEMLPL